MLKVHLSHSFIPHMLSVTWEVTVRLHLHRVPSRHLSVCACVSEERRTFKFALVTFVRQLTWLSPWENLSGSRHLVRVVISAAEPAVPGPISPVVLPSSR